MTLICPDLKIKSSIYINLAKNMMQCPTFMKGSPFKKFSKRHPLEVVPISCVMTKCVSWGQIRPRDLRHKRKSHSNSRETIRKKMVARPLSGSSDCPFSFVGKTLTWLFYFYWFIYFSTASYLSWHHHTEWTDLLIDPLKMKNKTKYNDCSSDILQIHSLKKCKTIHEKRKKSEKSSNVRRQTQN